MDCCLHFALSAVQDNTTTTAVYYEDNDPVSVSMNYTLIDFDTSDNEFNGSVNISMENTQDGDQEHLEFTFSENVEVDQLQVASSETEFTSIYQLTNGTSYLQYQDVSACLYLTLVSSIHVYV